MRRLPAAFALLSTVALTAHPQTPFAVSVNRVLTSNNIQGSLVIAT
jgi:hypothetical protein